MHWVSRDEWECWIWVLKVDDRAAAGFDHFGHLSPHKPAAAYAG